MDSFDALAKRLDHLSEQFNELRDGIRKALAVAELDPEMALTRARKVLEYVVRDVYERRVRQPPGTQPLENLLQRLVKDKHLPTRLEAYASTIRKLGNVGTHSFGEDITVADVSQSLSQLVAVLEWYFEVERPDAFDRHGPEARPPEAEGGAPVERTTRGGGTAAPARRQEAGAAREPPPPAAKRKRSKARWLALAGGAAALVVGATVLVIGTRRGDVGVEVPEKDPTILTNGDGKVLPGGRSGGAAGPVKTPAAAVTFGKLVEKRRFTGFSGAVHSVAFSADGKRALAAGPDNSIPGNTYAVRGWDLEAGEPNPSQPRGYLYDRVVFSPDGRRYLAGGGLQYSSLWDVDPLQRVRDFDVGPHVYCGAFSRNGRRVSLGGATLFGEPWVRVWELETGETRLDKAYPGGVHCVALSPDGVRAFSAGKRSVQLWDVRKGEGQAILSGVQVASADFSPDGKYLVAGTTFGAIRLLSADKGAEVRSFEDKHTSAVTCLAFSPDGKRVASGGADKAVRVWDVATGKELQCLGGQDEKVTAVAFSPDGRRILSGSADKTVRLWDPANGR